MQIGFPAPPPIGLALDINGQRYDLVEHRPHRKRDGSETILLVWQTECSTCGEGFTTASPSTGLPSGRRCLEHHRPGKPVRAPSERN